MWRRLYFWLLLVRFYFALQPSYIHPDEHFQGPEVMAGIPFIIPPNIQLANTKKARYSAGQ
jgi:phosphatidylinositol glycan class Z